MGLVKIFSFFALLSISCGYTEDLTLNAKSSSESLKDSDGKTALLVTQADQLADGLIAAGATELRKKNGVVYYEQYDSHLLLALPGVVAIFGEFGLPAYDEAPKCNDEGRCGPETQLTKAGWQSFFADLFKGMDHMKISYRKGKGIDVDKVIDFALNGR